MRTQVQRTASSVTKRVTWLESVQMRTKDPMQEEVEVTQELAISAMKRAIWQEIVKMI